MKNKFGTNLPKMNRGGMYGDQTPPKDNTVSPGPGSYSGGNDPQIKTNRTIGPTDWENATLEAELGETVVTNLQDEGIPEFYRIKGKRHYAGGTPLNLPPNSFIFSRDRKLSIKDPDVLKMFGKTPRKKGYTPAEISTSFDLNKYREILLDPQADHIQISTAEAMIKNYNNKLAALALAQESLKGFDNGIPGFAVSYLEELGIDPSQLISLDDAPDAKQIAEAMYGMETMQLGGAPQIYNDGGQTYMKIPMYNPGGATDLDPQQIQELITQLQGQLQTSNYIINPKTGQVEFKSGSENSSEPAMGGSYAQPVGDGLTEEEALNSAADEVEDAEAAAVKENTPDTEVETSTKSTKRQNVPKGSVLHDPSKEGYDPSKLKQGHYIKENGRWYKITGKKESEYNGTPIDKLDKRLKGSKSDLRKAYGRLENALNNNPDLQDKLYEKYLENVNAKKPGGILKQADIDAAKKLTKEEVLANYLGAQRDIMIINAQKGNIGAEDKSDSWDKGWDSKAGAPTQYAKTAKELGLDVLDKSKTFAFQAAYIGMQDLADDDEFKDYLKDYSIGGDREGDTKTQFGLNDEGAGTKGRMTISAADGWWGNTTTGQAQLYSPENLEWNKEEVPDDSSTVVEKEIEKKKLEKGYIQPTEAKWWTQDLVNIGGALQDLYTAKRYDPYQATPAFEEAIPEFTDFRGTAARIGSQAATGARGASMFAGPQAYASTFGAIQGQAADKILQAQEMEIKANTGIQNQFEIANTQAKNEYNKVKAGLDTQLWDKNVIANQQFDNTKRALRQNLRTQFNAGWTNRGMTQTMNEQRENFAVDPTTGFLYKKPGYDPMAPTNAQKTLVSDAARKLMSENPSLSSKDALDWAKADAGIVDTQEEAAKGAGVDYSQFMYPGMYGQQ